jgi:hypothetical protein
VVAIEFVDEHPAKSRLSSPTQGARLYNIVQYRQTTPSEHNFVRREVSSS